MEVIMVDTVTLQEWTEEGRALGATHLTIVGDGFSREMDEYPRYHIPGQPLQPLQAFDAVGATIDLGVHVPGGPCGCLDTCRC